MRNLLVFGVRENKLTRTTFSKCGLRVLKLVQINLASICTAYAYRGIFQISSPADNLMSEVNQVNIGWSRCSLNFIHAKIYPLKVNFGQFLTLPLPSEIFMHFFLTFLCFSLLTFLSIPFFRLVSTSESPLSFPRYMWIIPKEDLCVE